MKVIDLLNKIANGEEVPAKFRFAGQIFEKQGNYIEDEEGDSIFDSMCTDFSNINEEVEIIEETTKEELEDRVDKAIEFLETQHNTYPSGNMWRKALMNVLQGKEADNVYGVFKRIEKIDERILLQRRIEDVGIPLKEILDKINEIIDYLEEKK